MISEMEENRLDNNLGAGLYRAIFMPSKAATLLQDSHLAKEGTFIYEYLDCQPH